MSLVLASLAMASLLVLRAFLSIDLSNSAFLASLVSNFLRLLVTLQVMSFIHHPKLAEGHGGDKPVDVSAGVGLVLGCHVAHQVLGDAHLLPTL